jgi:hypothetical protein
MASGEGHAQTHVGPATRAHVPPRPPFWAPLPVGLLSRGRRGLVCEAATRLWGRASATHHLTKPRGALRATLSGVRRHNVRFLGLESKGGGGTAACEGRGFQVARMSLEARCVRSVSRGLSSHCARVGPRDLPRSQRRGLMRVPKALVWPRRPRVPGRIATGSMRVCAMKDGNSVPEILELDQNSVIHPVIAFDSHEPRGGWELHSDLGAQRGQRFRFFALATSASMGWHATVTAFPGRRQVGPRRNRVPSATENRRLTDFKDMLEEHDAPNRRRLRNRRHRRKSSRARIDNPSSVEATREDRHRN